MRFQFASACSANYTRCFRSLHHPINGTLVASRRLFASTAARKPDASRRVMSRPGKLSPSVRAGTYQTAGQNLAQQSTPTLLYVSPPCNSFYLGCYLVGGFCLAYGAINFHMHYLNHAPGTSNWVRYSFVGISLFVVIAGIVFLARVR